MLIITNLSSDTLADESQQVVPPSITDSASFREYNVVPGSLATIFGKDLAGSCTSSVGTRTLCDTTVDIKFTYSNKPNPQLSDYNLTVLVPTKLIFTSPEQINLILPTYDEMLKLFDGTPTGIYGAGQPVVNGPTGKKEGYYRVDFLNDTISIPSIFTRNSSGKGLPFLQRIDGSKFIQVESEPNIGKAALPGYWYAMYGTGRNKGFHAKGLVPSEYWISLTKNVDTNTKEVYDLGRPEKNQAPGTNKIYGPVSVGYFGPSPFQGQDQYNFFLPDRQYFIETMKLEENKVHTLGLKICRLSHLNTTSQTKWDTVFCSQEEVTIPLDLTAPTFSSLKSAEKEAKALKKRKNKTPKIASKKNSKKTGSRR